MMSAVFSGAPVVAAVVLVLLLAGTFGFVLALVRGTLRTPGRNVRVRVRLLGWGRIEVDVRAGAKE